MENFIAWFLRRGGHTAAALTLCLASAGASPADVVVIPPAKDNTLVESSAGSLSNGSGPALFVGRTNQMSGSIRRGVIAFDVAGAIPPGATITSAILQLGLSQTNAGAVAVSLHRVLAAWGEGSSVAFGGSGAPAALGDATWLHTFYDDRFWADPGGDFDPIPRANVPVDQPGIYAWGSMPEMVGDVQSWLDAPAGNHGWMLLGGEESRGTVKRFDSRESEEPALRPALEVEYMPACVPSPVGPGYWRRQCLSVGAELGGLDPGREGRGPAAPTEPGFEARLIPCADRVLANLGFASTTSCRGIDMDPQGDCAEIALRSLTTLAFNLCSGRLQTSCPADLGGKSCSSTNVGKLIEEVASLLLDGRCREALRCVTPQGPARKVSGR